MENNNIFRILGFQNLVDFLKFFWKLMEIFIEFPLLFGHRSLLFGRHPTFVAE